MVSTGAVAVDVGVTSSRVGVGVGSSDADRTGAASMRLIASIRPTAHMREPQRVFHFMSWLLRYVRVGWGRLVAAPPSQVSIEA
jgi:hypothetical protein